MRFRLIESKEDKQRFIDKFGKEVFDDFWSNRQLLKNKGVNADVTWHTKHTDVDAMKKLLQLLADERQNKIDVEGERIPEPNSNYDVVYQDNEWTVYHPKDYISSIHCANGARWCTAGGYQIPAGKVKVSQAKKYFNEYTEDGVKLFYYINKNGNKFALAMLNKYDYEIFDERNDEVSSIPDAPNVSGIPDLRILELDTYTYDGEPIPSNVIRDKIKKIIISDGVNKINKGAFEYTGITSIYIPDSVETIGYEAFNACTMLSNVELGRGVKKIGNSAFYSCKRLTSIIIPDNVKSIGEDAFAWSGLTDIVIPSTVSRISDSAFYCCKNLVSVTILGKKTNIGDAAFAQTGITEIRCPKDSNAARHAQEYNIPVKYI